MEEHDIIGNKRKEIYKKIEVNILENKNVFIYGNQSIGKSELINIFIKKHNYEIVTLNDIDNFTLTNITNFLNTNLITGAVESFFTKKKKKILLLDDYNYLLNEEYGIQNLLFSYLKKKKLIMPIVIIMTYNHKQSLIKYKRHCNVYNYECPLTKELKEAVINIYINKKNKNYIVKGLNNKINDKISKIELNIIDNYLTDCYYDMRLIMTNIDTLIYKIMELERKTDGKNQAYIKEVNQLIQKNKLYNLSLNDIIQKYFNDEFKLDDIIKSNNDFLLYSLLEHMPHEIISNRSHEKELNDTNKIDILDTLIDMNNNFSEYVNNDEAEHLLYLRNCITLDSFKKYPNYRQLKPTFHRNYKPSNICLKNMQYSNKIKQMKDIIENNNINAKNIVEQSYNIYIIDFLSKLIDDNKNYNENQDNNHDVEDIYDNEIIDTNEDNNTEVNNTQYNNIGDNNTEDNNTEDNIIINKKCNKNKSKIYLQKYKNIFNDEKNNML